MFHFADEETEAREVPGWVTTTDLHSGICIEGFSLSYCALYVNTNFRVTYLFLTYL